MSTNSPGKRSGVTGLGWPKRPRISRLLGWPFGGRSGNVSRETDALPDQPGDDTQPTPTPTAPSVNEAEIVGAVSNPTDGGTAAGTANDEDSPAESPVGDAIARDASRAESIAPDGSEPSGSDSVAGEASNPPDSPDTGETAPAMTSSVAEQVAPRRAAPEAGPVSPAVTPVATTTSPMTPDVADPENEPVVSRETAKTFNDLPKPTATRIMVVANQKGGVGKTTTSVNLAAALAKGGLTVLVVDLDPQGNASTALGVEHPQGVKGTYEVLIDNEPIGDHVVESPEASNLKVLPATVDLAGAEIELVSVVARENKLKRALKTYLEDHPTDYVLLDCPPSLGLLTLNALVAAGEVLIPIQCEYYALEGVSQLMNTIELVMGELNEQLELSTVLLTMYDGRTRLAAQVADEVRGYFAEQTLPTVIPRSVRISEAPSYGQTVLTYHPDSAGAVSYLEAAQEIARRGAKEKA